MQLNSPTLLTQFRNLLQGELFPLLESTVGPLSKYSRLLVGALSLMPISAFTEGRASTGRPRRDRQALATAFLAKAIYNLTTTRQLLDRLDNDTQLRRLCGWNTVAEIPAESTFSRAFAEFAATSLPTQIHAALIRRTQQDKTFACIARDSTAIEAREHLPEDYAKARPAKTPRQRKPKKVKAKKHIRRPFGPNRQERGKEKPPEVASRHPRATVSQRSTRIERQHHMTLEDMLAELPRECSLGVKASSKGHQQYWRGYKLHWDVASEGRIPISCVLTGARVHDSQVAIPLMELSHQRVNLLCDVMDSAYDATAIRAKLEKMGHEGLIMPNDRYQGGKTNKKGKSAPRWTEDQKERFKIRTIVEQQNGRLKDEFGGRIIYVRGAAKVMAHLMFGVLALTADQILRGTG